MKRLALLLALVAGPAAADWSRIADRDAFLQTVTGRSLDIGLFGISLQVGSDGSIRGVAQGQEVSGNWAWESGYFCRTLAWGSESWPRNCQLVQLDGNRIRFTSDQGSGDSARFTLN
ncbi:dihydrodipicolinate reductase [Histidinibacterium aquaticum]|uniref:Dihydrodipicolinate reductase n=1 Tax=Histidinibacterium aquaticum TaxID=2613962 RepID=A0A5J5GE34_9RHOB|nr:dihydrodipicolinate reductase [Histidinibacterium aquaticum]KAA9006033.1 dihydrodipicolinate reductase [Histidinibacterium aquaticum]